MEPPLSANLVEKIINFHGQQLQKIRDGERGEDELQKLKIIDPDYSVYQDRQKCLSFQDRGKRLKLQQFIVKKASVLYDSSTLEIQPPPRPPVAGEEDYYAVMPPYETFLPVEKSSRVKHFFQCIKRGDIVTGSISNKPVSGLVLKLLYTDGRRSRYVADLNIKAICPITNIIPPQDKKNPSRNYMVNDVVRCEVLEVLPDAEKVVCGMKGITLEPGMDRDVRLGLLSNEELPETYKKAQESKGESYEKILEKSLGFNNPNNTNHLANVMGHGSKTYSHMKGLRCYFPELEYASELRQIQASKWAFRSVAEGIEHFKSGRHSEAFQCLNKALNIDPRNVEGLVARGALYANSGSFQKAIEDFENALKLNPSHQNARKYMGETLVALGRSFEDENKIEEALKAYENCLTVVPFHEEAQNSIDYLKSKIATTKLSDAEVVIPGLTPSKTLEVKETLKQLLKGEEEEKEKEKEKERSKSKKKKDRKSRKRRRRSTSSSSSSTTVSSRSSTSSSSTSSVESSSSSRSRSHSESRSRSGSRTRKSKKQRKRSRSKSKNKDERKEKSLSPLSKRMALLDPGHGEATGGLLGRVPQYNPPALPFSFARTSAFFAPAQEPASKVYDKDVEYEQRVRRFLEQTKGDSEYEDKVRKFLEETARCLRPGQHRRQAQGGDQQGEPGKDRKKERKGLEKESKKKKKKDKSKSRDKEKGKKKKSKDKEEKDYEKKKKHKDRSKKSEKFELEKSKDLEDHLDARKFKEALKKELSAKEELKKRKSVDEEEEFLYGPSGGSERKDGKSDLRMLGLDDLPDLEDLESKLSAYYAKVEKESVLSKRSDEKPEKEKKRYSQSPGKGKHVSPKVVYVHHDDLKVEESLRLREKKKFDMFADSPSPPRESKPKLTAAEVMASKWKMQLNTSGSRLKKKERLEQDKEPWEEIEEERYVFIKNEPEALSSDDDDDSRRKKKPQVSKDKYIGRKGSDREVANKLGPEKPKKENAEELCSDSIGKTRKFYEKFQGGFQLGSGIARETGERSSESSSVVQKTQSDLKTRLRKMEAIGISSDSDSDNSAAKKKKQPQARNKSSSSSRSRSRSRARYSRGRSFSSKSSSRSRSYGKHRSRSKSRSYERRKSRSRSGSYGRYGSRSRSRTYGRYRSSGSRSRGSRSRSRSYENRRSHSRSYDRYSRSRSRSEDGHRRSSDYYHRRSRSRSGDSYRKQDYPRSNYRGRYPRQRGTYYRPQFQNYNNPRGFNQRGRNFYQKYGPGRGRGYNPRMRGRGRGRFFHYKPGSGYRNDRGYHRKYDNRARSRSRDSDDRRSYSKGRDDPMKKVDEVKEKINKYLAEEKNKEKSSEISKRGDETLSEGEIDGDGDDMDINSVSSPDAESDSANPKVYEGKWADDKGKEQTSGGDGLQSVGNKDSIPENSIEEMEKFLNKVKTQKKEEMKERNKSFIKPSPW